ncbi:MAG: AraC family transcriptional regulator [Alphaproteobacteria bacterium]|jgi:AraC-like DNA-binding protein|nr:AraC family transcriptional regulator [Alphaproteobacteria bacterium]
MYRPAGAAREIASRHAPASFRRVDEEIAALVGLANPDHFSTRFRKSFGLSPHGWRNRNK